MLEQTTASEARPPKKTILVTGANGYLGFAVSRIFARAGWHVFGLVRRPEAAASLAAEEIIPIVGSVSEDLTYIEKFLEDPGRRPIDVVVSCTEAIPFGTHYEHILALITKIAHHAQVQGIKPLVLMSSGCKDYGNGPQHGASGLTPHTEASPLNPMAVLADRAYSSLKIFEHAELFDAAIIRPTPLFGYDSSYYGAAFDIFAEARDQADKEKRKIILPRELENNIYNILHGCHIDDCAEAYLALAKHATRSDVAGQCFNISGYRYETAGDLLAALVQEYGVTVTNESNVEQLSDNAPLSNKIAFVLGTSQWVDSTKIRKLTGWSDKRMLLTENVHAYRLAYEAACEKGHAGVTRIRERIAAIGHPASA